MIGTEEKREREFNDTSIINGNSKDKYEKNIGINKV